MAPSRSKNSGPCARPRTKLSTSSAAQRAEKLLSVAPSAIATRQRVGESEPRIAHAERLDRERRRAGRVQGVDQRRFAGRVPMSRNWMTCIGCALKTNPRAPSSAGMPSSLARPIMKGVKLLDIS